MSSRSQTISILEAVRMRQLQAERQKHSKIKQFTGDERYSSYNDECHQELTDRDDHRRSSPSTQIRRDYAAKSTSVAGPHGGLSFGQQIGRNLEPVSVFDKDNTSP